MFCSPCGSGSNYSSASTIDCVTLCGAGISTFVVNPPTFTLSTLNVSSFNYNLFFPSSISTNVTNPYLNVNIPSTISTYLVNPCITLCGAGISTFVTNSNLSVNVANFPSFFSTIVTNPSFTVNIPSTISTNVMNNVTVNIPSTVSTYLVNPCVSLCGAGISTNITNSNLVVGLSTFGASSLGTVVISNAAFDTFSRLITETPTTLFTAHAAFTENLQSIGYVSTGTGTFTFDVSAAIILMSTTGAGASRAVRQTLEYQLYQPGKGHNAYFTWTPHYAGTFDTSVACRAGVYDDYRDKNTPAGTTGPPPFLYQSSIYGGTGVEANQPSMGHYFEVSGNQWFVVERRNSPDNVIDILRVAQSNWNGDTFNPAYGRNPSGYQLDADADNLFWIERQWLGVGLVRLGLYYNGQRIIAHQFGNRDIRKPYTKLNKLPIRYEIEKVTGGSSDIAVMGSMCMASLIDGEYTPIGPIFSLPTSIIYPTTRIQTTERAVLLIRLQQQYCRATIKIKDIEMFATNPGTFAVYKNPRITGTINWFNHPDKRSMTQYAVFANGTAEPTNTVSGGQCIQTGFFTQRLVQAGSQNVLDLIAAVPFASDIKGNPDVFCITMISASGNIDVNATARWLEIT